MSEASDGGHQPDPDPERTTEHDPEKNPGQGSTVNDPTAPVWADPTAPIPAPPAPPSARVQDDRPEASPYATPQPTPQGAHAASNPYAQQQPSAPPYSQPYPAYGQQSYATGPTTPNNTSAIILTVVSALSLCTVLPVASLVLGIIALSKNSVDPEASRRLTKTGWIVFALCWVVTIVLSVGLIALAAMSARNNPSNINSGF